MSLRTGMTGLFLLLALTAGMTTVGCGAPKQAAAAKGVTTLPRSLPEAVMKIHFMAAGNGESTLVKLPNGQVMLIDTADAAGARNVIAWLRRQGVKKIDYLVISSALSDYSGGLAQVVAAFPVGTAFLARHGNNDALQALLRGKGIAVTDTIKGAGIVKGIDKLNVTVAGPSGGPYADPGSNSAVIRIVFGETAFLFTGAAGFQTEDDMLSAKIPLKANLLKVARHGDNTATGFAFLRAVNPAFALISSGPDGNGGSPDLDILCLLESFRTRILRTDLHGTIMLNSNGKDITLKTSR